MNSMKLSALAPVAALIALVLLCTITTTSLARENNTETLEDVKKYDNCLVKAMFSFIHPTSSPPRTKDEFRTLCRSQADGFKCLKEQSKNGAPLVRRGILALVANRQRQHRRFCTNLDSDQSKKFLAASKCIMDNKLSELRENDVKFVKTFAEIKRRNYNDSAPELKQICCSFYYYIKDFHEITGQSCASHRPMLEELVGAIVTDDITIICEDDEKLAKVCPKLEKISLERVKDFDVHTGASTAIYLVATLGEPA